MIRLCYIILATICVSEAHATEVNRQGSQIDELTKAYQREILFLSTYKKELASKKKALQSTLGKKLAGAKIQLDLLQKQWVQEQTNNELLLQKLSEIEKDYELRQENRELLDSTIQQAQMSQGKDTADSTAAVPLAQQLKLAFTEAQKALKKGTGLDRQEASFFLKTGEKTDGEILTLGSVARYGIKNGKIAALSPAGAGKFRVFEWLEGPNQSLLAGQLPSTLGLFLYENPEKEFLAAKEKTISDVVRSGGLIGWVIIVMGLFALGISGLRFLLLKRAGRANVSLLNQVIEEIRREEFDKAHYLLHTDSGAVNRVLVKTLSYLKTEPRKVDDAILESVLKESQMIDRFGVVILVIASVAPLMGLLGTVTGMISTFDIITLYGTGNPKLLSGGISEALVTTMFGLIVAIPALLVGQYLSAQSDAIKSDMEQWALAACNAFKNRGSAQ